MKKLCLGLLLLVGCTTSSNQSDAWLESGKPRILSTIGMVDELVREVGGEHVARLTLIGGALDPHSYELVKGDDEKLAVADLIFYSGIGLEHGPSLHRTLKESQQATAIADAIAARDPNALIWIDGQIDPHMWMDVSLWLQGADIVAERLSQHSPEHADEFWARAQDYKRRLIKLDAQLQAMMAEVPVEKRYVVTSHDSCHYFSRRYLATPEERASGQWVERCTSPEGLAPDSQLSLVDVQNVVDHLIAYKVDAIFPESNLNRDSLKKIVDMGRRKGLHIRLVDEPLYGDAMGEAGSDGDTYEGMMRHNARVLREHLHG